MTPVIDIDEHRLVERRPRWRRWVAAGLILVLLVGVGWLVWFSTILNVRDVRVVGAQGAGAKQVLAAGSVPMGEPLARLDADAIAARVAAIDWVAQVEVRRGWPNEVVLAVETRSPIAKQVGTGKGVDASGVAFDAPGKLPDGLIGIDATGDGLAAAVGVVTTLPADLRGRVESVKASTRDDVSFTLHSGALVRWGSTEQAEVKAQVLRALLARRARMYDVTAPELPTTFDENPKPAGS